MSAFVVPTAHIAAIVRAAQERGLVKPTKAAATADMLMRENIASVRYRHEDPSDLIAPEALESFTRDQIETARKLNADETRHAIACLEYQSCEHPGWHDSDARKFLDTLNTTCVSAGGKRTGSSHSVGCWPIGE